MLSILCTVVIPISAQANDSCGNLFQNESQFETNLDPYKEFEIRLSRRDFQTSWGSSLDHSIVVVRYAMGVLIGHYAARVIGVTPNGDLEVVSLIGEKVLISKSDLSLARMGGIGTVKTFEDHEREFDTPYRRNKNAAIVPTNISPSGARPSQHIAANVGESAQFNSSLFDEYKTVLNTVAPPFNSKSSKGSDSAYISQGYWREWISDSEIPDQGWKLHVSAPVQMAGKIAAAILPKLRAQNILHKIVSDLSAYAAQDSTDTQFGKFITIYPKNDREAVLIRNMLVSILWNNNLTNEKFLRPPGELQVAIGVFARYGRFTQNSLVVNGRKIHGSENMLLLPNGRIIKDERGSPTPDGIQNPF